MNALETAHTALSAAGFTCTMLEDGGHGFHGPAGRGRVHEISPGRVRLRGDLKADDPVALARLAASTPGPLRITLVRCAFAAEQTCDPGELGSVLRQIVALQASEAGPAPMVQDLAAGVLAVALPPLAPPVFLRLAPAVSRVVDRARAVYLLAANRRLRSARGGWVDGPGLAVEPAADRDVLGEELFEIGQGLRVLGEESIAQSYLEVQLG